MFSCHYASAGGEERCDSVEAIYLTDDSGDDDGAEVAALPASSVALVAGLRDSS